MPRLFVWIIISLALLLFIAIISPAQLPVVLYKCSLVTIGAVLGYWLDRHLFPYARPHELFEKAQMLAGRHFEDGREMRINASLSTLRRALIILACVLGLTLGL